MTAADRTTERQRLQKKYTKMSPAALVRERQRLENKFAALRKSKGKVSRLAAQPRPD
jgi:hypothetical protein